MDELSQKVDKQEERIDDLYDKVIPLWGGQRSEAKSSQSSSTSSSRTETPPPPPSPDSEESKSESSGSQPEQEKVGWEEKLGGQWFAKIGIAVLVIGIALFLKYAFDNNWIGETGRVIIGLVAGLALLAWGERIIKKYFVYAQIITGGGLAILYLSIYAALNFYNLISHPLAFGSMILVTAAGVLLSLRYNAPHLLSVVVIGGFATPFLVSSGENHQIVLFSYVLLLDLAILAVSVFKKWRVANLLAFVGTIFTVIAWAGGFYTEEQLVSTVFFITLFFLVYSISSLIYNLVNKERSTGFEQVVTLLAGIIYFWAIYGLMKVDYHDFMGFFAVILAVYYFGWAYVVRFFTPNDKRLYHFLALLTIGFITLAVPIQFDSYAITLSWAVEAVLIFYIALKVQDRPILGLGGAVAALTFLRTLFIEADINLGSEAPAFFNNRFLIFIFVILTFYVIGYLVKKAREEAQERKWCQFGKIILIFLVVANLLTLSTISQEIIYHYDQQIDQTREQRNELLQEHDRKLGKTEVFYKTEGYKETSQRIQSLDYQKSITLSLFWMLYAIILMVVGFAGKYRAVRVGGIILLLLSILKLFFVDLWHLGSLYRIVSSIILGIVLLGISFAYNKYKDKIKEII